MLDGSQKSSKDTRTMCEFESYCYFNKLTHAFTFKMAVTYKVQFNIRTSLSITIDVLL